MRRSKYLFSTAVAGAALNLLPALLQKAVAATVGQFTFEALGTANTTTGSYGPYVADVGVGSAFGVHVATNSAWSQVAGNGSPNALTVTRWATGDYFEFDVPATGASGIVAAFDQFSSGTGPKTFQFAYSIDGTNFISLPTYTVYFATSNVSHNVTNSTGSTKNTTTWDTAFSGSDYHYMFDLSAITALNGDANAKFRIIEADTSTIATTGADRVDNFVVSGNVPEPATAAIALATAAGAMVMRRRNGR